MNRRLAKLESRKKALLDSSESILNAASAEDREFTQDEQATLDANEAELKAVQAGIEREQKLAEWQRTVPAVRSADRPDGWPGESIINRQHANFEDDPNKGFRTPREFFSSVLNCYREGSTSDERLRYLSGRRTKFEATAGSDEHGTYADPYGGFLVPAGFSPNLLSTAAEGDPTAGRTTMVPMGSPKVAIPARTDKTHTTSVSGGLVVYRRAETQTVTASRMTVEQVELSAVPLMGLSYATEELLTDSVISFVALIEAGFRDEFASKVLNEKLHGTGAGQYEGVINAPCTVSVAKETGQDAASIVFENIIKMRAQCWGYQDAIWLYNHDCLPQLMQLVMTIGTSGVPMWQNSAREGEPDMLLGRPAFPTEYCATLGTTGDILLCNWSQYLEGIYQPLQSAESLHVRFEYNERAFRFTMRNDGRSWWRSALTPKKSSTTLSPFVKLDARA